MFKWLYCIIYYLLIASCNSMPTLKDRSHYWLAKTFTYQIDGSLDTESAGLIRSALNDIESKTCVRFNERDIRDPITSFEFITYIIPGGREMRRSCGRSSGYPGSAQRVAFNSGCSKNRQAILHETCHALGFHHEHQRPDRNIYIRVRLSNTLNDRGKRAGVIRNDFDPYVPYDYLSIMHMYSFSLSVCLFFRIFSKFK